MTVLQGDCVELMAQMTEASVDAIVTDPPYGLGFMGKEWDGPASFVERKPAKRNTFDHVGGNHNPTSSADAARTRRREAQVFGEWAEVWATEALRILKPGGHLLAFGGTRTYHRLACAIEDAGFEIRDCLAWLYGSGFPKSLDVSKAINKAAGAEREDVYEDRPGVTDNIAYGAGLGVRLLERHPATPGARRWQGWGTALKPAFEPIVLARKPLAGTVAQNVQAHGTGALNVDGCRIDSAAPVQASAGRIRGYFGEGATAEYDLGTGREYRAGGRWPANVLLDPEAAEMLDEQAPDTGGGGFCGGGIGDGAIYGAPGSGQTRLTGRVDANGGASRFFYCAKSSSAERNAGLSSEAEEVIEGGRRNVHPLADRQADRADALAMQARHPTGRDRPRSVHGLGHHGHSRRPRGLRVRRPRARS